MGCKQAKVLEDDYDQEHPTHTGACFVPEIFHDKGRVIEKYQCPIMWGVLNDPIRAACGHVFCSGCIQKTMKMDGRRRCPVCRQSLGLLKRDVTIKKEIAKLALKCIHEECSWKGTHKGLKKHLKKGCKFHSTTSLSSAESLQTSFAASKGKSEGPSFFMKMETQLPAENHFNLNPFTSVNPLNLNLGL